LTKILLQLKYRQLAPSLHSEKLNPNIDFGNSPFIVQQELAQWNRPVIDGKEIPRRAGISSFGAGGANAHMIIEEYIEHKTQDRLHKANCWEPPYGIVLSAKNREQLNDMAKRLLMAIQARLFSNDDLTNMAYTLQVGREAMEERLALLVNTINELEGKLKSFLDGEQDDEDIFIGQVKRNTDSLVAYADDEDMATIIDAWIAKGKYRKLLDLWAKGLVFNWNKLCATSIRRDSTHH